MEIMKAYLCGILISASLGLVLSQCNPQGIMQCLTTFQQNTGFQTAQTSDQVKTACAAYPSLRDCLAPHTSECPNVVRALFETITNMYDYICYAGKDDAIQFTDCLQGYTLKTQFSTCEAVMTNSLDANVAGSIETRCGYVEDYMTCTKEFAAEECGENAAAYQDRVTRITISTLLESVGCGCASLVAMMWVVGGALILQWLIR